MIYLIYVTASSEGVVVAPITATQFWITSNHFEETLSELLASSGFNLIAVTNSKEIAKKSDSAWYPKWKDEEKEILFSQLLFTKRVSWLQIQSDMDAFLKEDKTTSKKIATWMNEALELLQKSAPSKIISVSEDMLIIFDIKEYNANLNRNN
jgi:hypothetical protein